MKLSQLSLADYNQLDSIPVINQDLSASGFTPVANTYYRHTGATTDTFTQGVIYLYDTAYHKLGESGGGTTLNKYTYTVDKNTSGITRAQANILARIIQNAKSIEKTYLMFNDTVINYANGVFLQGQYTTYGVIHGHFVGAAYINDEYRLVIGNVFLNTTTSDFQFSRMISVSLVDKSILTYDKSPVLGLKIIYYNDTEIT